MVNSAQRNKGENGYLAQAAWFEQSHFNTARVLKTYRSNQIIAILTTTN